ncbi:MAG: DNA polymerase III subunit gamma/tau [Spirochaetales bacterium]|nr:DNA polymerase III subunit gamma/tau [Spirochaetales bacterium]
MPYEVTATRKRPNNFDELVDQDFIVATLKSSIQQGMIAHAYLFSGPRGVGKTSGARILAKSLNCEKGPTEKPCGLCSHCKEIASGSSLDVIEIDGASNTSVNDVREIKDEVLFVPNSCRYKVYIIDEVHMLSNSAFNALLKTIEEPPPYIVFIFATTEIHKVPATIRSRCQQFNFKLISIQGIKERLAGVADELKVKYSDDALFWIAKEATGSLRDAYTLFDQIVSFSKGEINLSLIKDKLGLVGMDEMNTLAGHLLDGDQGAALTFVNTVLDTGIAIEQFLMDFSEYLRNILFIKNGVTRDYLLGYPLESFSGKVIEGFSVNQLEFALEFCFSLFRNLRYSLNPHFEFELLISRLSGLKKMISQDEILKVIEELKDELTSPEEDGNPVQGRQEEDKGIAETKNTDIKSSETEEDSVQPDINIVEELIKMFKTKKPALASSLEKIESWSFKDNQLVMNFKDGYPCEMIKKEKSLIREKLASLGLESVKLSINYCEDKKASETQQNEKIQILKKIFQGEIVKGGE